MEEKSTNNKKEAKLFPVFVKLLIDGISDITHQCPQESRSQALEYRKFYDALFQSPELKNKLQLHFFNQLSKYMKERDYPALLIEGTNKNWLKYLLSAVPYFPLNVFGMIFKNYIILFI
jgi:hypothetical protein